MSEDETETRRFSELVRELIDVLQMQHRHTGARLDKIERRLKELSHRLPKAAKDPDGAA